MFHLSKFLSLSVCLIIGSTCILFSDKLSPCRVNKIYLLTLSDVTFNEKRMIDSSCGISCWDMSCLLWFFFPFMEFFVEGKSNFTDKSYKFFVVISFALLQSNYFNFLRSFQVILFSTNFTQIPLNRYEKVTPFMKFAKKGKKNFKNIP